jgi:hypothetical protein
MRRTEYSKLTGITGQPRSKRWLHPGSFIPRARKAGDSNATVLAAHRLAGEPGT